MQVTDLRFARIGKLKLEPVLKKQRQRERKVARLAETAPVLLAVPSDMAESMRAVHSGTMEDNAQHNSVVRTFRAAGFCAFARHNDKMVKAQGGLWDLECPLENNRIAKPVWAERYSNVANAGQPLPTPWGKVDQLRAQQRIVRSATSLSMKFKAKIDELQDIAERRRLSKNILKLEECIAGRSGGEGSGEFKEWQANVEGLCKIDGDSIVGMHVEGLKDNNADDDTINDMVQKLQDAFRDVSCDDHTFSEQKIRTRDEQMQSAADAAHPAREWISLFDGEG